MTRYLFTFIALICYLPLYGQSKIPRKDSIMYKLAYDYIVTDSVGLVSTILPQNSMIRTSYVWFEDVIDESNNADLRTVTYKDYNDLIPEGLDLNEDAKKGLALFLKLQRFDEESLNGDTRPLKYSFPASYVAGRKVPYTLQFSLIHENEFFAELSLPRNHFGGGYIYLFIFNSNGTLREVIRKEIAGL